MVIIKIKNKEPHRNFNTNRFNLWIIQRIDFSELITSHNWNVGYGEDKDIEIQTGALLRIRINNKSWESGLYIIKDLRGFIDSIYHLMVGETVVFSFSDIGDRLYITPVPPDKLKITMVYAMPRHIGTGGIIEDEIISFSNYVQEVIHVGNKYLKTIFDWTCEEVIKSEEIAAFEKYLKRVHNIAELLKDGKYELKSMGNTARVPFGVNVSENAPERSLWHISDKAYVTDFITRLKDYRNKMDEFYATLPTNNINVSTNVLDSNEELVNEAKIAFDDGFVSEAFYHYSLAKEYDKIDEISDKLIKDGLLHQAAEGYWYSKNYGKLYDVGVLLLKSGRARFSLKIFQNINKFPSSSLFEQEGTKYIEEGKLLDAIAIYSKTSNKDMLKKIGDIARTYNEAECWRKLNAPPSHVALIAYWKANAVNEMTQIGDIYFSKRNYNAAINAYTLAGKEISRERFNKAGDEILEVRDGLLDVLDLYKLGRDKNRLEKFAEICESMDGFNDLAEEARKFVRILEKEELSKVHNK